MLPRPAFSGAPSAPRAPRAPPPQLVAESVRPRVEEEGEEVYKGVAAPKRKRVEEEPVVTEIPKARAARAARSAARAAHSAARRGRVGPGRAPRGRLARRGGPHARAAHKPPPPQWLEIKPEDDQKTLERKKKLLKSYKSKIRWGSVKAAASRARLGGGRRRTAALLAAGPARACARHERPPRARARRFQNMDAKQKEKQGSWQSFLKGKGGKAKAGFITGKKKQSMCARRAARAWGAMQGARPAARAPGPLCGAAAPLPTRRRRAGAAAARARRFSVAEGGKVGVVGSGRGMTDYKKAGRHDFTVDD